MKKIIILLLLSLSFINGKAYQYNVINYKLINNNDNSIAIAYRCVGNGYSTSMNIESSITTYVYGEVTGVYKVVEVADSCFFGCSHAEKITFGGTNVKRIGKSSFRACTGITSMKIPNGVEVMDSTCFFGCKNLATITLPSSLTSIGSFCFQRCSALKEITVPGNVKNLSSYSLSICSSLSKVTLEEGIISLGRGCFWQDAALQSITIPSTVTQIESTVFQECSALSSMTCKALVPPTLGSNVFKDTQYKTGVLYVPEEAIAAYQTAPQWKDWYTIKAIPREGYESYYSFKVNGIYYGVESDNTSNVKVTFREFNPTINEAWSDYSGLVRVPKTVTYRDVTYTVLRIGDYAFENSPDLERVEVNEGLTRIGSKSFYKCEDLLEVVLPSSITSIGDNTFAECTDLNTFYVMATTPPTLGADVFFNTKNTQGNLIVAEGCESAYQSAEQWKDWGTKQTIGYSSEDGFKVCADPTITFADGKFSVHSETPGAVYHYTITSVCADDGLSSDGIIEIGKTYTLTAYATAPGYSRSQTVNKTVTVDKYLIGDVNKNGNIEIGDISKLVDILLKKEVEE